jgi:site-specific DNA recombinase
MTTTTHHHAKTWQQIEALLRERDHDPTYADAPVLDVYARISYSPNGELEKTDRQLYDCLSSIWSRHVRLGEPLRDDNKSAWRLDAKRDGWDTLVQRLEAGDSTGVMCWHTDRLMRQPRDLEHLIGLGDRGTLVASCFGDYDLSNSDHRFHLRILTAKAANDSDGTSRRQKRKAEARRELGLMHGGLRPFGMPAFPNGTPVSDEQLAAEREAIAWAVQAHLDGVSLTAIADEWNARGLRTTRHGRPWKSHYLVSVLTSPRIAGLLAYDGEVVGELSDVEPIVSRDDWEVLTSTFSLRQRGRAASYLLSGGILVCERCERPMIGKAFTGSKRSNRPKRRRYACRSKGGESCGTVSIDAETAEAEVRDMVVRVLSDPKHASQVARASERLADVDGRLDTAKATARELSRRLGEDAMTLDEYDAAMQPLRRRIARLEAEHDALRDAGAGERGRRASADEVAAQWDSAPVERRRVMVRKAAPFGIAVQPATVHWTQQTTTRLLVVEPDGRG